MNTVPTNRIFGLDILRSVAIIIVVVGHSTNLIVYYTDFPYIPLPDGVDLFFVLSGYLVGTILIKHINQNQKFDLSVALNFLQRRWFRTLPNYFLFLLINITLVYFGIANGFLNKYLITYFVFFQNFFKPYDFLYWESWSLSVEEWFYFLFPFILLLLFKIKTLSTKQLLLSGILIFLLFPLIYRIVHSGGHADFDLYFRKLVLTRLDTIGYGLLAAYLHWYYGEFWSKAKNIFFILGLALLMALTTINIQNIFFLETFYYCFIGLSLFLMLPKLESIKNENIPFKPFRFMSQISYSVYLVHMPLLQIIATFFSPSNKQESILIYVLFWLTTIGLSYLVYVFFEKPLMNLREKIHIKSPF